ncbi:Methyltransferase domain-containing protein [Sunxiuqinia elliptica]|uniref:Methyltransferase domain-containing protein n=2 Tax=Sunxiuqinia elliptica TaxID=655355 RepID=A0A1I2IML0_9BACT|nr:Methyltransferase domain-containing protein [Sunxiuqinia elliptica]
MDPNSRSFDVDSRHYARSRPKYPAEFYDYLCSLLPSRQRLWDCACGNGQVAIDLANQFEEIQATDFSENQLKQAFRHPKITYQLSAAESTNFPNRHFDLICVGQALHWFNIPAFFEEANRILRSQGVLAIFGYGFFMISPAIDQLIDHVLHAAISPYWSDKNRLIMSGFQGVQFPFQQVDIPEFSMNQHWQLKDLLAFVSTWSAVKRYREEKQQDILEILQDQLSPLWEQTESKVVKMNLYAYIRQKE